jgi:hypothetical protein
VVADACGTSTALAHDIALQDMQQEGVMLSTTAQIIAELAQNSATPDGPELLQIMLTRSPQ